MAHDSLTPDKLHEAYRHVWFIVARSHDISTPRGAQLLDHKLTVFRDAEGTARVTDQRCIHRGGNLSNGVVIGDAIQCPYHGWQFNGKTGRCMHVPSLTEGGRIPPRAAVRSYPVIERFEHVWTCLGDPVFDLPQPPEIAGLDLQWRAGDPMEVRCGFMAATENFRDMSHFPFVHAPSMGAVDPVVSQFEVNRDGHEVTASYFYRQVRDSTFSGTGDAWMNYRTYAPGIATILYDYGPQVGKRYLMDLPSPVSYDRCVIYWAVAVDRDFHGPGLDEIAGIESTVFLEDNPILEGLDPKEVPLAGQAFEVSAPADIYTLNYRRATQHAVHTIQRERGLTTASAPGPTQPTSV
ncbi:Rieske 2Fe-2S domain-containing protein [Mycobacterium sp. smrl_JER01]|uniref:Rieske 2Fe-2S domain-containing protein n=1 Tax=Mycobacterium sp. smrl_JER01 TaxID=3402633 RepID=UPI003ACAFAEE